MKIVVTGGCGYIGSHTIVDLIANGFEVISIDNNSKSTLELLKGIEAITGIAIKNYCEDLCNTDKIRKIFETEKADGVIHFAAYKSVPESIANPLEYYKNNLLSTLTILEMIKEFDIKYHVFSSSCSVYGNSTDLPVTENTALQKAQSPYGATKQIGEQMIEDFSKTRKTKNIILRYFNPVGAHPSGLIGEIPLGAPQNLIPVITQTASGLISLMKIWGKDYDTKDGSCIRDYIHVCDIAHAHTLALQYIIKNDMALAYEIYNLGTGNGISVLETILEFEKITSQKLNYEVGDRRDGDVIAVYANNDKAKKDFNWTCKYSLQDMLSSAWQWQLALNKKNN
jgi:UDP-glucose 4-epimerase